MKPPNAKDAEFRKSLGVATATEMMTARHSLEEDSNVREALGFQSTKSGVQDIDRNVEPLQACDDMCCERGYDSMAQQQCDEEATSSEQTCHLRITQAMRLRRLTRSALW